MSKQFVCSIDDSVFTREEDLINHIRNKYITEYIDKNSNVSELKEFLTENFPDWETDITDGKGWYASYIITLRKDRTSIQQHYGNDKANDDHYYSYKDNPETLEKLHDEIQWKIEKSNQLVESIKEIGRFEDIYCGSYHHGYDSDNHYFQILYKLSSEEEEYSSRHYHPFDGRQTENEFIKNFRQYFVDFLEGEMIPIYDDGYFSHYDINGICIDGILRKAKTVKLIISEYK